MNRWSQRKSSLSFKQRQKIMERMAVLPKHRGKGYGSRLVRHAIDQAHESGAFSVGIGIIAADTGLKGFYKALGFEEEEETKTFPHLPFAVTFMRYLL
jgi:GNAT superfamily N-acetyltransferase